MDHWEVEELLKTFQIIVDTREQVTDRAQQRYKSFGCPYSRGTLNYGDYCGTVTLPGGGSLHSPTGLISPKCVVERKMNLDELASCFTRGRDRFRREFERADQNGAKVFLLCEDGSLDKILHHDYKSRFTPKAFLASVVAWSIRYNLQLVFCTHLSSGMLIREILYRDIKERAERGEFDAG